ncbi:MAG: AzlC family ABC transporter permease [Clostridia bacterium]|nr:AzlC family ABC transporter permease [Clostridia bacterium]
MKKATVKQAFLSTIPVMAGYLVLGIGFGVLLKTAGYGIWWAFAMSAFIYAGSMQYVLISLLTSGASLLTVALTTLMVNARHLFYGISMIEPYRKIGPEKPYLIFALTDETYSLVCSAAGKSRGYYLLVSLFDQIYWVTGSIVGSLLGAVIPFNTEGIDFALTALFLTIFTEQWLSSRNHLPALIGLIASALCVVIFGADGFLIPAMLVITALLLASKSRLQEDSKND